MRFTRGVVGYTRPVRMRWTVLLLGLLASAVVAPVPAPVIAEVDKFEPGKIIEKVPCAQRPEQSYGLYLPSNLFGLALLARRLFVRSWGSRQFCVATSKRRRGALWIHSCRVKQFAKRAVETAIRSRSGHGARHARRVVDRRSTHVFGGIFRRRPRRRADCPQPPLRSGDSTERRWLSVWDFSTA